MQPTQRASRPPTVIRLPKRGILAGLLLALLALTFWTGARYPALNEKALMGGDTALAGLGFDTLIEVDAQAPLLTRIVATTVNWMYTNAQGMIFGILAAALLMTVVPLLNLQRVQNRFANTVMGMVVGAPLGVCVNCAAPIAQGIYAAGGRVETALAAMMSSPTLNVVVLTMLFSLFPVHLAAIKVGLTLAFILIGIPLLTRVLPMPAVVTLSDRQRQVRPQGRWLRPPSVDAAEPVLRETWWQALWWVGRQAGQNLWYILKTAVPLMVLAGLLGSVMVVLLPFESLADAVPQSGLRMTLLMMGVVALVGVFLPVPMAFDVIVTLVLLQAGLPVKYAAILLFTLGIFSIYPFFIVWRTMSRLGAVTLFVGLIGLGVVAGVSGHTADKWHHTRQKHLLLDASRQLAHMVPFVGAKQTPLVAEPAPALVASLQQEGLAPQPFKTTPGLTISRSPFRPQTSPSTGAFRAVPGYEMGLDGLDEGPKVPLIRLVDPFSSLRGIAAGDVHNDGWSDLLVISEAELVLYANQQGARYVRQQIELPTLHRPYLTSAALIDVNNDGWLDLFFSAYRAGNHVIYNQDGHFTLENWRQLPNHAEAVATAAAAFGDIDRDGDLDMVLGNLTGTPFFRNFRLGVEVSYSPSSSQNALLRRRGDTWQVESLAEISAETWSVALTDINNDGLLDLLVGNDLIPPDYFYFGTGNGALTPITRADGVIPYSTSTTMSMISADIDNDLVPELFMGHISPEGRDTLGKISPAELCAESGDPDLRPHCAHAREARDTIIKSRATRDAFTCLKLNDAHERQGCLALHVLWTGIAWDRSQASCDQFPKTWDIASYICNHTFSPHPKPSARELESVIPQVNEGRQGNVLLVRDAAGHFVDQAASMGVEHAGWVWNAKFADLDNDEWQDLYIANGNFADRYRYQNVFFHNQQGKRFVDKATAYGLASWLDTLAYTYTDMDHDGDLDLITVPALGSLMVYINQLDTGHAIAFSLRDFRGNRFGIGSKIIIHYGNGRHQLREIQASGGYQSFDAPIAHFGLGSFAKVERVDVHWSTGERSTLQADFTAGARYIITRTPSTPRIDRPPLLKSMECGSDRQC